MKKKLFWGLCFLPFIVAAVALRFLPDTIPTHYNAVGEITTWGSKYQQFIIAPAAILTNLIFYAIIAYFNKKALTSADDKKKKESFRNADILWYFGIVMGVYWNLFQCYFIYVAIQAVNATETFTFDSGFIIILLGIVLIITGNTMPKIKMNCAFGLRTPWSMKNEKTWAVSQRNGGILFVVTGITCIICGGIVTSEIVLHRILLGICFAVINAAFIISYLAYRKYGSAN
ncbi:MAG: SdpI family protein [Oscillospiraceae bacterium]|nr:SdpI family protein [Oscillospiraceae bacterium]